MHTPGPWIVSGQKSVVTGNNDGIAECYPWPDKQGFYNARLISAAPELLAALEEIADGCVDVRPGHAYYEMYRTKKQIGAIARAAIAKAKGE